MTQDKKTRITVAHGDGIGPEIMEATLGILEKAGARLEYDTIEIGEKVYARGGMAGIEDHAWESLRRNKVFLKSPITTPRGGGFKSMNVTIRKTMSQFANVRPCVSYHPFVETHFPKMDIVIIRENEEDLYAGIEHRQTDDAVQCLKILTKQGTERIVRYAFEYARANGRKKVTCMVKDNIMKLADGMFRQVFEAIAPEYPEIEHDNMIIDIGAAKIAAKPEMFDVIVTLNLYGDIISDIAAEVTGSVGLCGSANIGEHCAMFEAIHGSAPDIAGKGIANPSGLLNGAIMMLVHIGQGDVAEKIQNAWLKTLEDGIHTGDIYKEGQSKKRANTKEFAAAIIERLGQKPSQFKPADYTSGGVKAIALPKTELPEQQDKKLVGVDIFLHGRERHLQAYAEHILATTISGLKLHSIGNRGTKVWPNGSAETELSDHWRCRFIAAHNGEISHEHILSQMAALQQAGLDFIKSENLYLFDGVAGFSEAENIGQGAANKAAKTAAA